MSIRRIPSEFLARYLPQNVLTVVEVVS
jgi:hypothetical protein